MRPIYIKLNFTQINNYIKIKTKRGLFAPFASVFTYPKTAAKSLRLLRGW